jgi:hypothetical protein
MRKRFLTSCHSTKSLTQNRLSAVVRGAAAKGLEAGENRVVLKRKSQRHYGTGCSQPFKYRLHRAADSFIDVYTDEKYARDQMSWLVKKGQDMHTYKATNMKKSIRSDFWPGEKRTTSWKLFVCNEYDAPQRETNKVSPYVAEFSCLLTVLCLPCGHAHC